MDLRSAGDFGWPRDLDFWEYFGGQDFAWMADDWIWHAEFLRFENKALKALQACE